MSLGRNWVHNIRLQGFSRERDRRQYCLSRQARVGNQDRFNRLARTQSLKDAFHRNPGAAYDRLPHHDLRIRYDHLFHSAQLRPESRSLTLHAPILYRENRGG